MATAEKILELNEAQSRISTWKKSGEKVVFTNGCFDIIHLGHVDYLEKARAKGDRLVVGLNTDASVSNLKGPARPINNEMARGRMLAALEFVDAIVFFSDPTPLKLIETLKPDILVKGSDYLTENIVGADFVIKNGGKVETVDLVEGYSTTTLIDKIKNT